MGWLKEVLTGTIGKCFLICDVCYFSVDFSQSVWPEKRGGIGKEAKERPSFEPIAGPHRFSKLINCTFIEILYMLYLSSETVLEVQENPNIVRHEWSACASSRPWARDGFPGVFTTFVSQIHKCKYRNTNTQIWAECLYWVRCWPPGVWYLYLQFHSLSYCRPNIVDVKIIFVLTITQNFSIYLFATLWLIFVPKLFISFQILVSGDIAHLLHLLTSITETGNFQLSSQSTSSPFWWWNHFKVWGLLVDHIYMHQAEPTGNGSCLLNVNKSTNKVWIQI